MKLQLFFTTDDGIVITDHEVTLEKFLKYKTPFDFDLQKLINEAQTVEVEMKDLDIY